MSWFSLITLIMDDYVLYYWCPKIIIKILDIIKVSWSWVLKLYSIYVYHIVYDQKFREDERFKNISYIMHCMWQVRIAPLYLIAGTSLLLGLLYFLEFFINFTTEYLERPSNEEIELR